MQSTIKAENHLLPPLLICRCVFPADYRAITQSSSIFSREASPRQKGKDATLQPGHLCSASTVPFWAWGHSFALRNNREVLWSWCFPSLLRGGTVVGSLPCTGWSLSLSPVEAMAWRSRDLLQASSHLKWSPDWKTKDLWLGLFVFDTLPFWWWVLFRGS